MQRFRFRLDGLLRLRSQLERAARRTLAVAGGEVAAVNQRLEFATVSLRDCEDRSVGTGAEAALARSLAAGLTRHRLRLERELRLREADFDRARHQWLERRRDVHALRELRRHRLDEHRQRVARDEQLELEETARVAAACASADHGEEVGS